MGNPKEGLFYLQYSDENWEQALKAHNIPGFNSIQDAIDEADVLGDSKIYVVKNHLGIQVHPVIQQSQADGEHARSGKLVKALKEISTKTGSQLIWDIAIAAITEYEYSNGKIK